MTSIKDFLVSDLLMNIFLYRTFGVKHKNSPRWLTLNEAIFALLQLFSTDIVKMTGFVVLEFKNKKPKAKKPWLLLAKKCWMLEEKCTKYSNVKLWGLKKIHM